jgi:hypothetical protein
MTNKVQLKRSTISGRVPTTADIGIGEIAINHADGSMYIVQTTANTVTGVTQIGASGAGTDYTSPTYVSPTETFTVNTNRQALFINDIVVDGNVTLSGDLIDAKAKDTTFTGNLGTGTLTSGNIVNSSSITSSTVAASSTISATGNITSSGTLIGSNLKVNSVYSNTGYAELYGTDIIAHAYPGNIRLTSDPGFGRIMIDGPITYTNQYTNFTSGAWDIGTTYLAPVQLIDNNGALNITITAAPSNSLTAIYDFFIIPKSTGTSVSWPSGSFITGSYDNTLFAVNYARVSISAGTAIAYVSYISSAGKTFAGNISAPTYTGNVIATTASITTANTATENISGNIVIDKAQFHGIKVDTTTPTYCWQDMLGPILLRGTAAGTDPSFNTFRNNLRAYQFAINNFVELTFHLGHDYVPGTDIYMHTHWAHASTSVTTGSTTWEFETTYAKGHNQAAFPASKITTVTQNASTTQYQHMIAETPISSAGGSTTLIDNSLFEPDGIFLVRVRLTANTMTGTPLPFVFLADMHYQSTGIGTKSRAPNFYA